MWKIEYLRETLENIKRLDHSQRLQVVKAINKVVRKNNIMKIVVVSARADDEVYILAQKRIE